MEALSRAAAGLAAAGQPHTGLAALDAALAEAVGHRLFTVLVLDAARGVSRRAYSSRPEAYPILGEKPLRRETEFHRLVVEAGRPRFCRDRADIIRAFPDHALILSLGCEGAVNLPIRWDGQTLGALNLLHGAGHYDEAQMPVLSVFAALAVAPVLRILADAP
ncbi:GAF domain-containing protein [Plastoroseomonas hellenica]|uniref:GAF domain-containing protein n=1 Tax=Plastoroseomonas hellenica TaxID=2687306 RepID=UPI001BA70DAB|nr:GAF domain-containing protein [Plastoroseomonas hellenica]MBR0641924.1 GAF domain-containing protein [Plastoroseomonas hellenica]